MANFRNGKISPILLLDIIGFVMIIISAAIIRYATDPFLQIASGLIGALGLAVLGIARMITGLTP